MNTQPAQQNKFDQYIMPVAVGVVIGIIIAVLGLEYYGYIQHSTPEDTEIVEEYKLLTLNEETALKVSASDSGRIAFCADGYLLIRPANDKPVAGILVDKRKRAVHCASVVEDHSAE